MYLLSPSMPINVDSNSNQERYPLRSRACMQATSNSPNNIETPQLLDNNFPAFLSRYLTPPSSQIPIHENFEKRFDHLGNEIPINVEMNPEAPTMWPEYPGWSTDDLFTVILVGQLDLKSIFSTKINQQRNKVNVGLKMFKQRQSETLSTVEQRIWDEIPEMIERSIWVRNLDEQDALNTSFMIPNAQSTRIHDPMIGELQIPHVSFAPNTKPVSEFTNSMNRVNHDVNPPCLNQRRTDSTSHSFMYRNSTLSAPITKLPTMVRDFSDCRAYWDNDRRTARSI